ncbi:hypothetical protein IMZ29_00935 [Achromobacter sp. GG226]|uniref:hypothetical protein n=1 Tax=Verticiella alkaliphila TaxID=2779529 RepID=UPI001C0BA9D7|nr:hypothetical protein [Verticiella sp. GG226]MBU4609168.1 hypothetical protein [Verticiella sp. GG226]
MNTISQIPRKPVTELVKDMLDGWRRSLQLSQSKIVQKVVDAHKAIDAERTTEIVFEEERRGRDTIHCQRINMQKVYRWLGGCESEDDGPGNMPANFLPSVLASMPVELRVKLANDILAPAGLVTRAVRVSAEGEEFDPSAHVLALLKEFPEAKKAAFELTRCTSTETLQRALVEATEAKAAAADLASAIEGELAKRGAVRLVA